MKTAKQLITDTIIGLIKTNKISVLEKDLEIACLKAWQAISPYAEYTAVYSGDYILNIRIDREDGQDICIEILDENGFIKMSWSETNPVQGQLFEGLSTVLDTFIQLTNKG